MKRLFFCLVFFLSILTAFSQRVYFVYIQTESEQPFYAKLNDKSYSSSSAGYLVLSKLVDSSYDIHLGFPQNKWPEQKFSVAINAKDHGYLLKKFEDNSWGLFDLQTLAVQKAVMVDKAGNTQAETRAVSAFTDVLSKAANDPSLKDKPVAVVQEQKTNPVQQALVKEEIKPESVIANPLPVVIDPVVKKEELPVARQEIDVKKENPLPAQPVIPEYRKSVVTKKGETSTTDGFGLTFIDEYADGRKDTVRIVIPHPKTPVPEIKEATKESQQFLNIESKPVTTDAAVKVIDKNDCSSLATESDFLKLRKKMVAEANNDAMTNEAQKVFRSKCFTVAQVKNLGVLFLDDAGKYKFFDAAYTHVSDVENFGYLQADLKDEYYVNRFKAMLK